MITSPRSTTLAANAAGIATALAFLAEEAEAAIVSFTPDAGPFTGTTWGGVSFNPMTSDVGANGQMVNIYACGPGSWVWGNTSVVNSFEGLMQSATTDLAGGSTFSAADLGTTNLSMPCSPSADTHFYLGFGFRAESSSDAYNLGWVEVSQSAGPEITVYQWAYESNAGQAIQVGVVPEPATTALITASVAVVSCLAARRYKPRTPDQV